MKTTKSHTRCAAGVRVAVLGVALAVVASSAIWARSNGAGPSMYAEPYAGVVAGNLNANQNPLYEQLGAILGYTSPHFDANANAMVLNDGLYSQQEAIPGGYRIQLNNGDVKVKLHPFELKGGYLVAHDEVKSPYSLFFNPDGFPTTTFEMDYSGGIFFYKTRWMQLNYDSADGYPDRGMNYKVYGVHMGRLRVGFQDVVLYVNQVFSAEYLLSPIPMYLSQLVNTLGDGNPQLQNTNENTLIGFFGDYTAPKWYGYAQVLIDDVSLGFLVPQLHVRHPWKLAWSLGGTYTFPFGTFGFYQAGASKYTFEASTESSTGQNVYPYQYTYFPAVDHIVNGNTLPIPYDQNYIGYKYGENNLSFLVTYKKQLEPYTVGGNLEYRISGSESPGNPWQTYGGPPYIGWELLDQWPLEQRVLLSGWVRRPFGKLVVSFGATLGYVSHELELTAVSSGGLPLLAPSNTNRFLYQFDLGVSYKFSMSTSKAAP